METVQRHLVRKEEDGRDVDDSVVLEALGDRASRNILLLLHHHHRPLSVREVMKALNLSQSTVYNKLHWLAKERLIEVLHWTCPSSRRDETVYQSRLEGVMVKVGDKVDISVHYCVEGERKGGPSLCVTEAKGFLPEPWAHRSGGKSEPGR